MGKGTETLIRERKGDKYRRMREKGEVTVRKSKKSQGNILSAVCLKISVMNINLCVNIHVRFKEIFLICND